MQERTVYVIFILYLMYVCMCDVCMHVYVHVSAHYMCRSWRTVLHVNPCFLIFHRVFCSFLLCTPRYPAHLLPGSTDVCYHTASFPWVLRIQTQILILACQGLYFQSHLLNGKHDLLTLQNQFEFEQYKRACPSLLITGPRSASMAKRSCPMLGNPL